MSEVVRGYGSAELKEPISRESLKLAPRSRRWGWVETAVLAGYAVIVAAGIAWHEAWADEAQAWLLARDNGWWDLMMHRIRYEGSPGLWHSILWVLARLHFSYAGMHWATGVIALAGIFAFLRWSPLPKVLNVLLPFGFWLAYQDAVVARSYVIFAVLAFPAAAILRRGAREGLMGRALAVLAVLLGLMANLSFHGLIVSLGFTLVAVALLRRQRRAGVRARVAGAAAVLLGLWAFAVSTTFPPSAVNFPAGKNLEMSAEKIQAKLGSRTAKEELKEDALRSAEPRPGELVSEPAPEIRKTRGEALWHKIARILALVTFPVSNFRLLALAACGLVIAQAVVFGGRRQAAEWGQTGWIGLLPWAMTVLIFAWMYLAPRHAGILWETLVASLWLTWPAEPMTTGRAVWLRRLTLAALVLVAADQAWWTAHAAWNDMHQPYAGDEAMAHFLAEHGRSRRVAGFAYHSIGVEGWFDHPIYMNQPTTYWVWSKRVRIDPRAPFTIAEHPDIVVVGGSSWSARNADISDDWVRPDLSRLNKLPLNEPYHILEYAEAHGYRETHRFCGHAFMRDGYSEELCQVALERTAAP